MAEASIAASETARLNRTWAARFVAALADAGVRDACVCSGSRSAPLALAFHRASFRTHVPLDERAGAFFALGLAKASRRPVAIVTTSGTAAANLLPALVEAFHARVPLIALTADRPPELRDAGAAQTIDQIKMFAGAVRWFHEVGTPAPDPDLLAYVSSLGTRAAAAAWGPPAGPVHLNFPFREPLVPEPEADTDAPGGDRTGAQTGGSANPEGPDPVVPSPAATARAARLLRSFRRGLILCGPEDGASGLPEAVARLAAVTGYPVLADPASQVRYGPHDRSRVLGAYDLFLRAPSFAARHAPEVTLQLGAPLTSKAWHQFAARHPDTLRILVDPGRSWRDPSRRARAVFASDPTLFAQALAESLARGADPLPAWSEAFAGAESVARGALERHVAGSPELAEETVFPALFQALPEDSLLYVGNSMAIRDLDLSVPASERRVRVLANRGANGIDGVISSGLGASAAGDAPVLIVTGDLSFHHDLNGLAPLREGRARATIVVLHNDGGGIFSFLPVARHGEAFERYFGTPHGLDFEKAAALYEIPFTRCRDAEALRRSAAESLRSRQSRILEIRSDRARNRARHEALWGAAVRAVEEAR